jgi:hypothetical protein
MTAADYRQRAEHGFAAVVFSDGNPYRSSIVARLESPGGQYAASRTADRFTRRDDIKVDLLREVAECKVEGGSPF